MRLHCRLLNLLLIFAIQSAAAFSFNTIEIRSYQNDPLNARIYITESTDEAINSYQVTLANAVEFQKQHLPQPSYLSRLQFTIVNDGKNTPYLLVTSTQPLPTDHLIFLIAVSKQDSNQIGIYKINLTLLQAPLYMNKTNDYFTMSNENNALTYGPTTIRDTLAKIAKEMLPAKTITLNQMMLALVKRNPDAFYEQNINGLQAGRVLQMPSLMMIQSIKPDYAMREVKRQNATWRDYLQRQTEVDKNYLLPATAENQQVVVTEPVNDAS